MIGILAVLRASITLAISSGLFFFTYPLADTTSGEAVRLGLRGLKRKRAIEQNELWAMIEPFVRWLAQRLHGFIPEATARSLETDIALAGDFLGLVPSEFVALSAVTAVAGGAAGIVLGKICGMGNIITMVGFGYGLMAPHFAVSNAKTERFKSVGRRLPHAIDLLSLSMGAGLDFPGSVRQVVEKAGNAFDPLVEEFTLILQSLHLGRSRRQALEEFARRVPCEAVVDFVSSVVQAELRGTPVANVLRIQAEVSRQRRSVRAEESASKAGVKMIVPLTMVFVCVMILVIAPIVLTLRKSGI